MLPRHDRAIEPGVVPGCGKFLDFALRGSADLDVRQGGRECDHSFAKFIWAVECSQGDDDYS